MEYEAFTSLPPEEEKTFVVYEERMRTAASKASKMGYMVAGGLGGIALIIVLGFWAPLKPYGAESEQAEEKKPAVEKKEEKKDAPAPTPTPATPAPPAESPK